MRNSLTAKLLCPLVAVSFLALSCSGGEEKAAEASGLDFMKPFVGSWEGTQEVLGNEDPLPASYEVKQEGDTIVWNFESTFAGGFTGNAVSTWDEASGKVHETWNDSMSEEAMKMVGSWDATAKTLTTESRGPSFEDPEAMLDYRHITHLDGDHFSYTMVMLDPAGPETEVMWIHMDRKSSN